MGRRSCPSRERGLSSLAFLKASRLRGVGRFQPLAVVRAFSPANARHPCTPPAAFVLPGCIVARAIAEVEDEIRHLARPEQERLLRTLLEEWGLNALMSLGLGGGGSMQLESMSFSTFMTPTYDAAGAMIRRR